MRAHDWSVHESNDKGGYCAITIDFVPGGGTVAAGETDAVDVAYDRNDKLADAAVEDFTLEPMSFDGMTAFVAAVHQRLEMLRQVISLATLPLTWASQVMNLIAGVKGDLATLMAIPSAYANALRSLTNSLGGGADDTDYPDTSRVRVVARIASAATTPAPLALSGVASTDGAVRRNLLREEALRCRLLVTAATEIAMADYRAEADRDAALAAVVAALDALLPNAADPVFEAAVAARAAVIEALMAQDLNPAAIRDVANPLPAVVLAHRLGVDESVFLARNAVRHPLFVKGRVYG
ncbi:hypothetical protein [Ralstonia pseudosolanacearum]|uniref:hypothetical protein n=1 Tax=Ralstonia pseudosolanacearum TaxID=1310165 RepID=UPI0020B111E2